MKAVQLEKVWFSVCKVLLSKKRKTFSQFPFAFSKFRLSFEHFQKKKMTLIADVFLNLRTPKMSKKSRSRGPFDK